MNKDLKIVMLVGKDDSSNIMYHALKDTFQIEKVIIEEAVSKKKMISNRIKRLGFMKVFGQVLFILFNKLLSRFSRSRIEEIMKLNGLNNKVIDEGKLVYVDSINDEKVIEILQKTDPDAVVVNGTRIISERVLNSIPKPFVNTHAGITPKYRGVHGGYWALANGDAEHCGVTVHLVDAGIDTGGVLYQETISITEKDSFNTYPMLQLAKAIPLMERALGDIQTDTVNLKQIDLPSKLWYHPTLWRYIGTFLRQGVK